MTSSTCALGPRFAAVSKGFPLSFLGTWSVTMTENDGLDPEVIIAREKPLVEQFARDLKRVLGREYRMVPFSGEC